MNVCNDNSINETLLNSLFDGVYFVDNDKKITFWNKSAEEITGYKKEDIIEKKCSENILRHIDYDGNELCLKGCPLAETLIDQKSREANVFLHHKDGHRVQVIVRVNPLYNEEKKIIGAVEIFTEISIKQKLIKEIEKLKKETMHDNLTQIANRRYAEIILKKYYDDYKNIKMPFGILFIDIDNFKSVNDNYGHNAGDAVLKMVGKTLNNIIREIDVAARWGGEEFIIVYPNVGKDLLAQLAERARKYIEKTWVEHEQKNIFVTLSIGATMFNKDDDIDGFIKRADELMYNSKKNGKNRVTFG